MTSLSNTIALQLQSVSFFFRFPSCCHFLLILCSYGAMHCSYLKYCICKLQLKTNEKWFEQIISIFLRAPLLIKKHHKMMQKIPVNKSSWNSFQPQLQNLTNCSVPTLNNPGSNPGPLHGQAKDIFIWRPVGEALEEVAVDTEGLGFDYRADQIGQYHQQLAIAATFLCTCLGAKPRRWTLPLVTHFDVIPQI